MEDFGAISANVTAPDRMGKDISMTVSVPCSLKEDIGSSTGPKLYVSCPKLFLSPSKGWPLKRMRIERSDGFITLKTDGLKMTFPIRPENEHFFERLQELKCMGDGTNKHSISGPIPSYRTSQTSCHFASQSKTQSTINQVNKGGGLQFEKKNAATTQYSSAPPMKKSTESPIPSRTRPLTGSPYSSPHKLRPSTGSPAVQYRATYSGSPMMSRTLDRSKIEILDHLNDRVPDCTSSGGPAIAAVGPRDDSSNKPGQLTFETKSGKPTSDSNEDWLHSPLKVSTDI